MEKINFLIIPVMFIYFLVQNDNYSPKKNKAFALTGRQEIGRASCRERVLEAV